MMTMMTMMTSSSGLMMNLLLINKRSKKVGYDVVRFPNPHYVVGEPMTLASCKPNTYNPKVNVKSLMRKRRMKLGEQ